MSTRRTPSGRAGSTPGGSACIDRLTSSRDGGAGARQSRAAGGDTYPFKAAFEQLNLFAGDVEVEHELARKVQAGCGCGREAKM
jgi:hypothetical protein